MDLVGNNPVYIFNKMTESLLPERAVQFSPSLAAIIGVEEAILLQHIHYYAELNTIDTAKLPIQLRELPYQWAQLSLKGLSQQLPFWQPNIILRLIHKLTELGMLVHSKAVQNADEVFFIALTETSPQSRAAPKATALKQPNQQALGAQKIHSNWQPERSTFEYLYSLGIPQTFCQSVIEEFILYWQERNEASHAWGSKFAQHVVRRWQSEQQRQADRQKQAAAQSAASSVIQAHWRPNQDAVEILTRMGINQNFIVDAIPEFVLYWQDRGEPQNTWNSKFVAHTKRQWARFTNTLKHDTEPRPMADNWRPDEEVYEVLTLANIDRQFASELIAEFTMYWRDRNELHHSWNTKFLQYVKYQWSRQHRGNNTHLNNSATNAASHENNQPSSKPRKTRDRSLAEDLLDRSWAN